MDTQTETHPPPDRTEAAPELAARQRRAVIGVLAAAAVFSIAGALVKGMGGALPLAQVVLCRNLFAIPALLPLLWQAGGLAALRTRNPALHAARMLSGLGGMAGAFYGYAVLPLALVTALGFTMPLFLTLLSIPLLGERVGPRRGLAVLVGFGGVLLVALPGGGGGATHGTGMLAVLGGAVCWALSMITIRRMGHAGESNAAIVLWFALGATLVSAIVALPVWVAPSPLQWAMLIGTGLLSALAQVMMTEAYRRGEATLLAPFEYSAILWTTLMGGLVWSELPDGWDAAGIAVLVASGLYIWRREVVLGLRR
ncbi:DMT family transporter [Belnapia rosea]|uniref:Permease of the drug/metabolite transporter (DMT) superfamily n=1 Tax=Belnapia rosea TaxID=938405 RepID=A0A1G6PQN2_9PROT|nr:DMT family transporter [Belnapia rosea]SDB56819.1 Permease of the drug/metabolite transporter (DMT) superfamily [Belnapia rosea]SDC82348.1 Permease of the drug/metabolite transporter (DMT) superfamily [Belnapia rosea]